MLIHQSWLASYAYCPQRLKLENNSGGGKYVTSYLAFGSVIHHSLHVLERHRDLGRALDTFRYFWHPHNVDQLAGAPVAMDGWGRGHSYGRLLERGVNIIRNYWDTMRYEEREILALEYEFIVPIPGTDHHLGGTLDQLNARWFKRQLILDVADLKSGKQKYGLRHSQQGHAYTMATTQREFWVGFEGDIDGVHYSTVADSFGAERGQELFDRFTDVPRHFTWVDLNTSGVKQVDGGYRGEPDYQRFAIAVEEFVRAVEADIYPLRMDGETCGICPVQTLCGLPDDEVGSPN